MWRRLRAHSKKQAQSTNKTKIEKQQKLKTRDCKAQANRKKMSHKT